MSQTIHDPSDVPPPYTPLPRYMAAQTNASHLLYYPNLPMLYRSCGVLPQYATGLQLNYPLTTNKGIPSFQNLSSTKNEISNQTKVPDPIQKYYTSAIPSVIPPIPYKVAVVKNGSTGSAVFSSPTLQLDNLMAAEVKKLEQADSSSQYHLHGKHHKKRRVLPTSMEYNLVTEMIPLETYLNINQINFIWNPYLHMQFKAQSNKVFAELSTPTEKWLWHGTDYHSTQKIFDSEFNRSFSGRKNGSSYGKGAYFSPVPRHYYCGPNEEGVSSIILAKVILGKSIQGTHLMSRENLPLDVHSTVDNLYAPFEYVVYHDASAYPCYEIMFHMESCLNDYC